jgi:transposase
MSGDSRRYDIVAETRRRWSRAEKRAVVAEASAPGVNVSEIARHATEGSVEPANCASDRSPSFVPVALLAPTACAALPTPAVSDRPARPASSVEIELITGRRVRVDVMIDAAALKRIIDVLEA